MKKFIVTFALRLLPDSTVKSMYLGAQLQLLKVSKQVDPQYWVELYTVARHDEEEIPMLAERLANDRQDEFSRLLDIREMAMRAKPKLFQGYANRHDAVEYFMKTAPIGRNYDSTHQQYKAIVAEREQENKRREA